MKQAVQAAFEAVATHPVLLGALAAAAVVVMVVLVGWFLVFSGLNEPVQFVYSSF